MKYYIAVYEKLRGIYLSRGSMANDLPMICPSLRMYENEDLALLKPAPLLTDQQKKIESTLKKQNVSYELNSLPISPYFWDLNVNTALFDVYREILQNSNIKNFEENFERISVSASSVLNDSKGGDTKEFKNYKKYRQLYEMELQKLGDHLATFDEAANDDQQAIWRDSLANLNAHKEMALAEWKVRGSKDLIENEFRKINGNSEADLYLALAHEAKFSFDSAERTDITTNSSIHDINFIPYDFMDNESGWNTLNLSKIELEQLYQQAKNSNTNLPAEILTIDYDETGIAGIEVDYTFVHLKRSWFNKNVLLSPFFQWNEPQPLSDGETISDQFKLPAYPKTMMLIKNLKIILEDAVTEQQVNAPDRLIFFGPMVMKQQLFINQNTNTKFLKVVTDSRTLKSEQLTYLSRKTVPAVLNSNVSGKINVFEKDEGDPVPPGKTVVFDRMKMGSVLAGRATFNPVKFPDTKTGAPAAAPPSDPPRRGATFYRPDFRPGSSIFIPINLPPPPPMANVIFRIFDAKNSAPLYKCSISIIGVNSNSQANRIFNIETDQNGTISQNIPAGNYKISLRADEYAVLDADLNVPNTNPLVLEYKLQRQEIKFKSFFLIGMVCEKLPKIPVKN